MPQLCILPWPCTGAASAQSKAKQCNPHLALTCAPAILPPRRRLTLAAWVPQAPPAASAAPHTRVTWPRHAPSARWAACFGCMLCMADLKQIRGGVAPQHGGRRVACMNNRGRTASTRQLTQLPSSPPTAHHLCASWACSASGALSAVSALLLSPAQRHPQPTARPLPPCMLSVPCCCGAGQPEGRRLCPARQQPLLRSVQRPRPFHPGKPAQRHRSLPGISFASSQRPPAPAASSHTPAVPTTQGMLSCLLCFGPPMPPPAEVQHRAALERQEEELPVSRAVVPTFLPVSFACE
jgi:hypothetical protein